MNIINLTPHTINIYNEAHEEVLTLPKSGLIARIDTDKVKVGMVMRGTHLIGVVWLYPDEVVITSNTSVPLFQTTVTGKPLLLDATGKEHPFPEWDADTLYVVSGMFRSYFNRDDMYQPGELIRDAVGKPLGCIGLSG